ncbi:hypothetical protein PtrSN002B_008559 [Pyrenophora tritici-repentis]|uniref:Uncharacterized protein n=2 Tax=Pyrenophora tritici-repentis TaxID=45151 RepID=A0A2W1FVT7_9PLEO|nr:uncharacterized protein PTRG_06720 [Pyrenophora tritici-repentis Pt-1C-BFP]KAF7445547.1 hypothetical protein A1F99_105330 [Pyrenophora tritici-repentis]EDU49640.1 conserved hypothetical protein [Pyrenophora tritici-repentis Pt-1C-BFP]KAF7565831.1 hypothetical protein PtrM4_052650 [Pyrenophora tritici-repentis]KAI0574776.1 hypothetical protein Alg215_08411 [Pyrenophora tritici-repentis]KAI1509764.1 hypothetical protein Ptr86124_011350 [Pyrenophora tritici-repentis]
MVSPKLVVGTKNWPLRTSTVTSTILRLSTITAKVAATTATVVATTAIEAATTATNTANETANEMGSNQGIIAGIFQGADKLFWRAFIIASTFSLIYYIVRRKELLEYEEVEHAEDDMVNIPWETKDWNTLYGLLGMAFEDETMYTPIRREYIRSIQKRFKQRPQLRMLLEKGIVPLFIQDGGVSTIQTRYWSWNTEFPYVKLAYFEQAKRRACFEFILPHPRRKNAVQFEKNLSESKWDYGVQRRECLQDQRRDSIGSESNLAAPYPGVPLSVGAESALEPLLPIMPDKPLNTERSEIVNGLRWYMKNGDSEGIPLLYFTELCIIRVEAGHWGPAELDSFVLGCAEEADMQYRWRADEVRKQAIRELGKPRFTNDVVEREGLTNEVVERLELLNEVDWTRYI